MSDGVQPLKNAVTDKEREKKKSYTKVTALNNNIPNYHISSSQKITSTVCNIG